MPAEGSDRLMLLVSTSSLRHLALEREVRRQGAERGCPHFAAAVPISEDCSPCWEASTTGSEGRAINARPRKGYPETGRPTKASLFST